MAKVWQFLKPYKGYAIGSVILVLIHSIAQLTLPTLMAEMINNGIVKGDRSYIYTIGALMLVCSTFVVIAGIALSYCSSMASAGFGREARRVVFRKVEQFSLSDIDQIGTPSLITRTTNDIRQVQDFILMGMRVIISAPFMLVGGVIMAFIMNKTLSMVIFIVIPVIALIALFASRFVMPLFDRQQKNVDALNSLVREKLSGIRVIRAFQKDKLENERFEARNEELMKIVRKINRLFAVLIPLLMLLLYGVIVSLILIGVKQVDALDISTQGAQIAQTVGNLQAFMLYLMMIIGAVGMAAGMFVMFPRARVSVTRIAEVMDIQPDISSPQEPKQPARGKAGQLAFDHVAFEYPGATDATLHHICFETQAGKTTAIIGSTGSGKSSIVNLIPRFYDVTGGRILLDGVDIREMEIKELHRRVGFIPQKAFLFSGTVADNLRYGKPDATEEEMWAALRIARADEFVRNMPRGLDSLVSQSATNLSGGQKQRLAIARALMKRAEIYVFDDSFSALDFKTDAQLRAGIRRELSGAALIIVAQRIGTILDADTILVLDAGRIVGRGTHRQLLESCAVYREIAQSQLSNGEAGT